MYLRDVPDVLCKLFHTKATVELEGGPGIGKTESIYQVRGMLEKQLGEPVGLVTTILSQLDSVDVRGFLIPRQDEDGTLPSRFTTPPIFPMKHLFNDGQIPRYGILFLDERRQAPHDVQKTLGPLLLEGRIGEYDLAKYGHWVTWCASNRMSDKAGTYRDLSFMTNRILRISIHPHLKSWTEWAERHGVNPLFIAFANRHPAEVFRDKVPDDEGPFCTPRTLVKASEVAADDCLGFNHPHLTEVLSGYIGEGTAAELMAFAKVADIVPTIEEIVSQPTKAFIPGPDRPDAQYYAMQLCVFHFNPENCLQLLDYVTRMPKEFQVSAVQGAIRAAPDIVNNAKFSKWLVDNRDLITSTLT